MAGCPNPHGPSQTGGRYEFDAVAQVQALRQTLERNHTTAYSTGRADIGARVAEAIHNDDGRGGVDEHRGMSGLRDVQHRRRPTKTS